MARPDRLNVWLEAFARPIGQLARSAGGALAFAYAPDHLEGFRSDGVVALDAAR